jgi:hypothetical protein
MATKIETITKRLTAIDEGIKTANEKIIKLQEERATLVQSFDAVREAEERGNAINRGLPVGTNVTFVYGRAESKRTLQGVVKGTRPTAQGCQYKIGAGTGFAAELFTVLGSAIESFDLTVGGTDPVADAAEENR